jgi:hypothetical protein
MRHPDDDDVKSDPTRDGRTWVRSERTDTTEQPAFVPGMEDTELPDRTESEKIGERQRAYQAAAVVWFLLVCVFLIVGSFVLRLVSHIL